MRPPAIWYCAQRGRFPTSRASRCASMDRAPNHPGYRCHVRCPGANRKSKAGRQTDAIDPERTRPEFLNEQLVELRFGITPPLLIVLLNEAFAAPSARARSCSGSPIRSGRVPASFRSTSPVVLRDRLAAAANSSCEIGISAGAASSSSGKRRPQSRSSAAAQRRSLSRISMSAAILIAISPYSSASGRK